MFSTLRLKVLTFSYSGSSTTPAPTSSAATGSTARQWSVSGPLTCSPPLPPGLQFLQWTVNIKCLPSCATITAMSGRVYENKICLTIFLLSTFCIPSLTTVPGSTRAGGSISTDVYFRGFSSQSEATESSIGSSEWHLVIIKN